MTKMGSQKAGCYCGSVLRSHILSRTGHNVGVSRCVTGFFIYFLNTALSVAPQILLCRRMLGLNPGLLLFFQYLHPIRRSNPGSYKEMSSILLTNSASYLSPNAWGRGGVAGSKPMSIQLYTGAQINFGDLNPYLTYALTTRLGLIHQDWGAKIFTVQMSAYPRRKCYRTYIYHS